MNRQFVTDTLCRIGPSVLLIVVLSPCAAMGQSPSSEACNALVSLTNNLYLVNPAGKVLTQFTSDGTPKSAAVLSPDGRKVAYVADNPNAVTTEFEVVNAYHQQATYPIFQIPKRDDPAGFVTRSAFADLSWSSDSVLGVVTTEGKDGVFWLFRRIPYDLGPRAPLAVKPPMEDSCALNRERRLACLDSGGAVYLNGDSVSGRMIFNVTGFEGIKPGESFTLGVGESVNTQDTLPIYTVTLVSINKNELTLRISLPNGLWQQPTVENGGYAESMPLFDSSEYGFFATLVKPGDKLVKIDVVKSDSPDDAFDPALAWTPDGRGLVLIRRTNTQAFLYLIRPGRADHRGDARDEGRGQWMLAAQAVIDAPEEIDSMRFASPSLLLLKDDLGNYSEVPIQIGRDHGSETLTLGTVTALPSTLTVQFNNAATQGAVLNWSCEDQHGHGDH